MKSKARRKARSNYPERRGLLAKVPTRVAGLDEILEGGLPAGRTSLVSGGPGSGKSVLAIEFLYRAALEDEPGIFVTFEERAKAVRENALAVGMDTVPVEEVGKFFLMEAHVDPEAVVSGDFNLKALLAVIEGKAKPMGARYIVFDALDVLLRLFDDAARERNELYALHDWLTDRRMTSVLTVKASQDAAIGARYEFLDFMADCVIHLDQRVQDQISTRRLRVIKYRGSGFRRNEHPFVLGDTGIRVIPMSSMSLRHRALGKKVSSGHKRLDTILYGGYRRGSSALISGTSGTGKTTVAATFALAACKRREKVLFIDFEESEDAVVECMLSPGIDLRPALKAGRLRFLTDMPEAMGIEEHLIRAFDSMNAFDPDHVVVDAVSSCARMGSEKAAFEYIMRLVNACKERGITTILINQTDGFQDEHQISGVGMSSIIDTVIFLRYIDVGGEINRMLLVMKSRGAKHANQYREFLITDKGIDIADVYVGEGGVLTGAARQEQEAKEEADRLLKQQRVERMEKDLLQLKATVKAEAAKREAELVSAELAVEQLRQAGDVLGVGRERRGQMRGEEANSKRLNAEPRKRTRKSAGRGGDKK